MAAPTERRYRELFRRAKGEGLNDQAAQLYATLAWWGEWYEIRAPRIISGYRSPRKQKALQRRWDRGDRRGLRSRPADRSAHTTREAFDLAADDWTLAAFGSWARYLGARWGGDFSDPDPPHFDVRR